MALDGTKKNSIPFPNLVQLLACIGQVLEEDGGENICGAVVNVRRGQDKLCLWTRDADQKDVTIRIGFDAVPLFFH